MNKWLNMKNKAHLFATIVFVGLIVAICFHVLMSYFFHLSFPWDTFLFSPSDRFKDLVNSVEKVRGNVNPYYAGGTGVAAYFPFAYLVLKPFSWFSEQVYISIFVLGSALWLLFLCYGFLKESTFALFATVLLSYPWIFAIDRGNFDVLIFLCVLTSLIVPKKAWVMASLFLGAAIAFKGYPLLFVAFFVVKKEYLKTFGSVAFALILTLFAGLYFEGGMLKTFSGAMNGLAAFENAYVKGDGSLHYFSDPYNAVKLLVTLNWLQMDLGKWYTYYPIFSGSILFLLMWLVFFTQKSEWEKLALIGYGIILFPRVSNDYKLLLLIPAVFFFIKEKNKSNMDVPFIISMSILLIPKQFYYFSGVTSISCFINPLAVLFFIGFQLLNANSWKEVE